MLLYFQANPRPRVAASDVVQASPHGAGHQEGPRRYYPGAVRAASTLAGSCKFYKMVSTVRVTTRVYIRVTIKLDLWREQQSLASCNPSMMNT